MYFSILLSNMKVNCISIDCFISSHFSYLLALTKYFFSYLVVAYICTLPSQHGFKMVALTVSKWSQFAKKCTFEA